MKKIFIKSFVFFVLLSTVSFEFFSQESPTNSYYEKWYYFKSSNSENQADNVERLKGISMVTITKRTVNYIIGEHSQSFTARTFVNPYQLNKFETTYALWYNIVQKAIFMGYEFENPGQEGSAGRRGKAPTEYGKLMPVVAINWRDAVVWCNALSEIEGLTPCYEYDGLPVKDATDAAKLDLVICNKNANGYRLPTEAEWEYAARKTNSLSTARGDYPSGYEDFSGMEECNINSDGTNEVATSCKKNAAGLYDMTGNVLEFCNDWFSEYSEETNIKFGKERVCRGGSWSKYTPFCAAGDRYAYDPSEAYNYIGFRLCRNFYDTSN
ncbi:MAG: formylglycine-generating enzyme family protein [Treponemataceae bacterium]